MDNSIPTPANGERRRLDRPMRKLALLVAMLCAALVLCASVALAAPRDPDGEPPPPPSTTANPFSGETLYIDTQYNPARITADQWYAQGRTADAQQMEKIAQTPRSKWFNGSASEAGAHVDRAAAAGQLPVLTGYAIPH